MAFTPQTIADLRVALGRWTGMELKWFSIARSCQEGKNYYGWHLGKDQMYGRVTNAKGFTCVGMGDKDPSVQHPRDKAGLTNARAAIDIHQAGVGGNAELRKLNAFLVAEAKAGRAPDIADILGPGADGRAYYWAAANSWKPVLLSKGNSHEWHDHIGFRRDSEKRDKRPLFERYFAPSAPPPPEPPPPPPPPPPPHPLEDDMPAISVYVPGHSASVGDPNAATTVRSRPSPKADAVVRTFPKGQTEQWWVTGWVAGEHSAFGDSDQWLVRWANGSWEYTAKGNVRLVTDPVDGLTRLLETAHTISSERRVALDAAKRVHGELGAVIDEAP